MSTRDEALKQLAEGVADLRQRADRARREVGAARERVQLERIAALVSEGLPAEARELAATMVHGHAARHGLEATARNASKLRDRAQSRFGPPKPIDPKTVNWDQWTKWEDVPADLQRHMPDEVFARMARRRPRKHLNV